ncbi:MAG: 4-diphosphocytidyl-2C-methyl-D-erythritol kinase [Deltaproteobacteria bacterium]|nr:4-diphosphocytidyl-2C-methyl-D-erythritol kinase [Deltaproteobacteria bacterium]
MIDEPKQGTVANWTGSTLEKTIVGTLVSKGFQLVAYRDYTKSPQSYGEELLLRNVPFITIYGHNGTTEFLLKSKKYNLNIRIEAKWQQISGSVDEKYPYLYLNCIEAMPESDIIIVIDGGGAKQGAVNWLRNATANQKYCCDEQKRKKIKVMNLTEFLVWANNTFR